MSPSEIVPELEQEIIAEIKSNEIASLTDARLIDSVNYIQLADLYHLSKRYQDELNVLSRYVELENANKDDFIDIYERIERISQIKRLGGASSVPVKLQQSDNFSVEIEFPTLIDDEENITLASSPIIKSKNTSNKLGFSEKPLIVLSVCSIFTGREDTDEIIQLALVLFEYDHRRDKKTKIIETFSTQRKTIKPLSEKVSKKFNLTQQNTQRRYFDKEKIKSLFQQADFIVSHNDSDVERKLLSLLIPEISVSPWYSSQKDIPWGALGFESNSLTRLSLSFGEKSPKSAMDRALAICKLLQKEEPGHSQVYLERLYYAKPMKPFEWTPKLIKQHHRLTKGYQSQLIIAAVIFVVVISVYFVFFS